MTGTDVDIATDFWLTIKPAVTPAVMLILLFWLVKITDLSVKETISNIFGEFVRAIQGERSAKTLNALGGVVVFAAMLFLYFAGIAHLTAPLSGHHTSDYALGVYAFVVFTIAAYFIICVFATRHTR